MDAQTEERYLRPGWAILLIILVGLVRLAVALILLSVFPITMLVLYLVQWGRGKI